jgi:serine O-acetyltransferase
MNQSGKAAWHSPMQSGEENANPSGLSLWSLLREDFETHGGHWTSPGFWALAVHRLGNWRMSAPVRLRPPLTVAYRAARRGVVMLWGIDMPYSVPVGRRLRICHHGGVHLGAWSVGDDVTIRHSVTIGVAGLSDRAARSPIIGNGVELGPGASVLGTVTVGDGAYVGPNAVVVSDVPPAASAMGVPARIVRAQEGATRDPKAEKTPR